ncbi:Uncharacterised protein [Streptococcus pneumoniae]|nr:Uncharacterised protein [Streptococcus pneumoniae]
MATTELLNWQLKPANMPMSPILTFLSEQF